MGSKITVVNLRRTVISVGKNGQGILPGGSAEVDGSDPKIQRAIDAGLIAVQNKQQPTSVSETNKVEEEPTVPADNGSPEVIDEEPAPAPVRKTSKPKEGS